MDKFSEIIDDKQTYPNTAFVNLRIDSNSSVRFPPEIPHRGLQDRFPGGPGANGSGTPTVALSDRPIVYPTGKSLMAQWAPQPIAIALVWCYLHCLQIRALVWRSYNRFFFDLYSFVTASKFAKNSC
ncbi:MAG: hypothetical protein CM15mV73_530 [Caudoviricetes sp.]|nr:MAG: hypothetical protein CM15mV73_530 [Caudoviricetes sp.]